MWYGISLWPCISVPGVPPKILPTCWGRWGQGTPARNKTVRGTLRKPQPWASGAFLGTLWGQGQLEPESDPSSEGPMARQGRAVGAGGQPCCSLTGPSSISWHPQGLMRGSGCGHWTGTLCPSSALEALTKVVSGGNFILSLIISTTIQRTRLLLLLSKCAAFSFVTEKP